MPTVFARVVFRQTYGFMLFELRPALEYPTAALALEVLIGRMRQNVFLQFVLTVELFLASKMFAERTFIPEIVQY